jgi:crotonobetainyl-CoA:carnitine CoA-transferase CaiB-like acyl-CoA transferase
VARRFDSLAIPASRIQTAGEVLDDPQLAALGQMQPLPEIGGFAPALPIEFAGCAGLERPTRTCAASVTERRQDESGARD